MDGSLTRRLESAIRQVDRKIREGGGGLEELEALREQLNSTLDEATYSRRSPPTSSGLGRAAQRLSQVERQMDVLQHVNALQEEVRWVDEEASQARRELEDRLEARIMAVEARVTAFTALSNETEARLKELERRADANEQMTKRNRLTVEELADKVATVVSELQQRVMLYDDEYRPQPVRSVAVVKPGSSARSSSSTGRSEQLVRDLLARVEALEHDVDGERERSIRAVELVATALTPNRNGSANGRSSAPAASAVSPDRGSVPGGVSRRRPSLSAAGVPARGLPADDYSAGPRGAAYYSSGDSPTRSYRQ